jgi:hypothetical protein
MPGSGLPGPLAILGGVHGNEPGGWLAADNCGGVEATGAYIVRAPTARDPQFVRTTDELGDPSPLPRRP